MTRYEDIVPPKYKVDPLNDRYMPFYNERTCGNCQLFKCEPWSIQTGICQQFGGVVQRQWTCVLDPDGKLKVTRQEIV